jgi:hypothetical protein
VSRNPLEVDADGRERGDGRPDGVRSGWDEEARRRGERRKTGKRVRKDADSRKGASERVRREPKERVLDGYFLRAETGAMSAGRERERGSGLTDRAGDDGTRASLTEGSEYRTVGPDWDVRERKRRNVIESCRMTRIRRIETRARLTKRERDREIVRDGPGGKRGNRKDRFSGRIKRESERMIGAKGAPGRARFKTLSGSGRGKSEKRGGRGEARAAVKETKRLMGESDI